MGDEWERDYDPAELFDSELYHIGGDETRWRWTVLLNGEGVDATRLGSALVQERLAKRKAEAKPQKA